MRRVRAALFLFLAGALAGGGFAAPAQTLEEARGAYAEGRFLDAATLGEALGDAPGLALAADALAIHGFHRVADEDDRAPVFERAMADAERAVQLDPSSAEAHMQLAHAMGRYAQTLHPMTAFAEGFAERIRDTLEAALALDGSHARAHLALAGWNAGVVDGAGSFMARTLYGATVAAALEHYEKALELAPDSIVVGFDYAENLLMLDEEAYGDRARALLRRAVALPPADAYGEIVRARARDLLATLGRK